MTSWPRITRVLLAGVAALALTTVASPALATAKATTHLGLHATESTVHVAGVLSLTGSVKPKATTPVVLQRLVGKKWVALAHQKPTATGTFAFSVRAPKAATSWQVRVVRTASGAVKQGISAALTIRVVKPIYLVTASATASTSGPIVAQGTVRPKTAGVVTLQRLQGKLWASIGSAHLSKTSTFVITTTRPVGAYRLRVVKAFSKTVASGVSKAFTVMVTPPPPVVTTTTLTAGMVARPYSQALSAASGVGPYSWTANGLPAGLTLSSDGTLSGTPTTAATSSVVVTVTDSRGSTGSATLSLTIAVTSGAVVAWGTDVNGELGNGTTMDSLTPTPVSDLTQVVQVAGGAYTGYALKSDGTVWAWGSNYYGQLGNNTTINGLVPSQVIGLTGVTSIAAGFGTGYAVKSDGTVWAWGEGNAWQLGNNSTANSSLPVQVSGLSNVRAVAGSSIDGYAVKNDGTVWVWGAANHGALGDNQVAVSAPVPVQVPGLTSATAVAAGTGTVYVLLNGGFVKDWGYNGNGSIGNGSTTDVKTPTDLAGVSNVVALSAGDGNGYALRSDGTVYGWGANSVGELGNGLTTTTSLPVKATVSGVKAISAHGYAMTALKTDGSVVVWGDDGFHGLGTSTVASVSSPVTLTGIGPVLFLPSGMQLTDGLAVVAY